MERDYSAAVGSLNTLQTNFAVIEAIRKSGRSMNKQAIPEMIEWCRKAGYEPSDFDRLKPIHIAGTKGKGSTSAFVSSILSQYARPTLPTSSESQSRPILTKTGLYTSPHLRFVRERIKINNEPLDEPVFTKYFFQLWDRLEEAARKEGKKPDEPGTKPVYFRYLTLMALHAYMQENVDTAVMECGIGGEHDSTNILVHPTVTAVTSLGIDHVNILGSTIEEIAWHKSGIFKPGAAAFTVSQPEAALKVLHERAAEKGINLHVVPCHPELEDIKLGLAGDFQKTNASLAIAVAAAHLRALGHTSIPDPTSASRAPLPPEFRRGLEQVHWPGRCEIRREGNLAWHIDGGHTLDSIELAGRWFASQISNTSSKMSNPAQSRTPCILLFNQQTRDAPALAKALHGTLVSALDGQHPFTHAIFCTNVTFVETGYKPDLMSMNTDPSRVEALAVQKGLAEAWEGLDPMTEVKVVRTIEEAVRWVRAIAGKTRSGGGDTSEKSENVMVLVVGSLHLVGGVLEVLETTGAAAPK